jgi:hypothetical protein
MPSREAIIEELKGLGRGQLENFNQIEKERKSSAGAMPVQGYSPDGGYCHGVCLDWVRRVLQGGRPRFGPNPQRNAEEGYDYNASRQAQAKRQGYAWASFDVISARSLDATNAQKASNKADYDKAYDAYVAANKFLMAAHSDLVDDYNDNAHLGEAHVVKVTYGARLLKIFPQLQKPPTTLSVKNMRTMYEKIEQRYQALQAPVKAAPIQRSDMDQRTWSAFTKNMDAKFPKGKSFGGIDLIQLHPTKSYGSLPAALASVTDPAPTDFRNSRAMIVGVDMQTAKGDTGHAVAVHWHPKDFFVLLDPNYGMFIYERLAGAKSVNAALSYLFGKAYPAEPGLRVLNDINYEIFAKREG